MSKATPIDHFSQVKAMVNHTCDLCMGQIHENEEYVLRSWLTNDGYTRRRYHVHCDALNCAFDDSEERTRYKRGECLKWLKDKFCKGCSGIAECNKPVTLCPKILYDALPMSYVGAAISSQQTNERLERKYDKR